MGIDFGIEDRPVDDYTHLISLRGELDFFTAAEFKHRIAAPLENEVEQIIVDLTRVTFVDSSCLGVLLDAHRRLDARDGRLFVACRREAILKTLRITGLDGVFAVVPSVQAALHERSGVHAA